MASPLEILIGLHYWTTPTEYGEHEPDHQGSLAVINTLSRFVRDGLLEKLDEPNEYGGRYRATDALGVWVEALCIVPFPIQKWVIPDAVGGA